jgi:hypothetical protein
VEKAFFFFLIKKKCSPKSVFCARCCKPVDWIQPTEVLWFRQYFNNWENLHKTPLNFQIPFGEKQYDITAPIFPLQEISRSCMVAPEGPQVPFCFVLFICLVLVTICS